MPSTAQQLLQQRQQRKQQGKRSPAILPESIAPIENIDRASAPDFEENPFDRELREYRAMPPLADALLRLEQPYKVAIADFAKRQGVTPETLLQGIWDVIQESELLQDAVDSAIAHHQSRKRRGELKKRLSPYLGKSR